jgi:uncharacterized protein (TIGR02284 family)
MTDKIQQLNELLEVSRDGQRFYQHDHDEVQDARLKALLRDMSQSKVELIRALAVKVSASQEKPADGGTVVGMLRYRPRQNVCTVNYPPK